ncbi:MAG: XRE family transcriptional regulator [Thermomicrobiales bacterium]
MELGEAIKARRAERGLTLEGLAGRCGVSRAMLSEIERGAKTPTIRIVAQIAAGLGTTVGRLIGEEPEVEERVPVVVRAGERRTLVEPQSGMVRQELSPGYLRLGVEVLWCSIPPGGMGEALPALRAGAVEHVTVVRGVLRCRIGGRELLLGTGDAVYYEADRARVFGNGGEGECEYLVICDQRGVGAAS